MSRGVFADVAVNPRGHLGILVHEAVHRVVAVLHQRAEDASQTLDDLFERFPFLKPYLTALAVRMPDDLDWAGSFDWLRSQRELWEAEAPVDSLPLRRVQIELELSDEAVLAFVLTGIVEEEPRFGDAFAALHGVSDARRPTIALLAELLRDPAQEEQIDCWSIVRPLIDGGLIEVLDPALPRSEWQVRTPPALWSAAGGDATTAPAPGVRLQRSSTFDQLEDLILPNDLAQRCRSLPALLLDGHARALIVRGLDGCPRLELIGAVARSTGHDLAIADGTASTPENLRRLGAFCALARMIPVFSLDLAPGETFELPSLAAYRAPLAALAGLDGGFSGPIAAQSVVITLQPDLHEQRLRYWQQVLPDQHGSVCFELAHRFALPGRYIRQAAKLAFTNARLEGRLTIAVSDVRDATRMLNRQLLNSLATRLDDGGTWNHMVLADSTAAELRLLGQRCQFRERLMDRLSGDLPGGLNRGVRALFEGPSGTGKTLAARVLASELGLDVYRVDLAAVINKYIGETEKNLSRILSRAEDLDVVLLLDEGDALMSRRTDVKSSTDRYANLETNYLLQRLESYSGIVIITTNLGNAIDAAFRRRIDVFVKFALPDAQQRWLLWQLHLPADHALEPDKLEALALRHALTGGQIRNAAVNASLAALARGSARICAHDVETAIRAEYRKAGAAYPAAPTASPRSADGALQVFLSAIS